MGHKMIRKYKSIRSFTFFHELVWKEKWNKKWRKSLLNHQKRFLELRYIEQKTCNTSEATS